MAKCEPWKAQGGKSRSNFWKASDDRFIIKTVVNAWNVADLYVAHFSFFSFVGWLSEHTRHRENKKPYKFNSEWSVGTRANLLGFYTVEVRKSAKASDLRYPGP
jgi:hypothetical protein